MVSHITCSNVSLPQTPPKELYKVDLWQHLVNVTHCSFRKAVKRKQDLDREGALCDSFESLGLEKKKEYCLTSSFKRLCLDDDGNSDVLAKNVGLVPGDRRPNVFRQFGGSSSDVSDVSQLVWSEVDEINVFGERLDQDDPTADANGNLGAKPASSLPIIANL